MGRRWQPSIADQLEDVADSLLNAAYAVTAIAEQLREKSPEGGNRALRFPRTVELARGARLNLVKNLLAS
jgi:hypothetical protein